MPILGKVITNYTTWILKKTLSTSQLELPGYLGKTVILLLKEEMYLCLFSFFFSSVPTTLLNS